DGNMRTGVHTRKIINPVWGSKLTGTSGRLTFGVINASDESPEDIGNRGAAVAGRNKLFTIGRATYGLGEANYLGAIMTDTEHAGRHNRVFGSDVSLKFKKRHDVTATFLSSQTGIGGESGTHAVAAQATYNYSQRKYGFFSQ